MASMEKRSAHYQLQEIQAIVSRDGRRSFTSTAIFNSLSMGLTWEMVVKTILSMTPVMFYKSMTTRADHTLWQDVYHVPCQNGKTAYVKVTLQAGAVVIQFKEK